MTTPAQLRAIRAYEARGKRPGKLVALRLPDQLHAAVKDKLARPGESVPATVRRVLTEAVRAVLAGKPGKKEP